MALIAPITARRGVDIGSAPSTARDDSVGRGARNLGNAVQQLGNVAQDHSERLIQQKNKMDEFATEQRWQQTQLGIAAEYDQARTNIDPSGADFAETINKDFIKSYDAFLGTVPEHLKPKFAALVETDHQGRLLGAAADEVKQRNAWYEVGISDTVNRAQSDVAAIPEIFDQKLAEVHRTIESSGLPPAKQEDLKRSAEEMLGRAWADRMMRDNPTAFKTQLGVGEDRQTYFDAIRTAESGGNDNAKNPNSTATGRYQFIQSTWDGIRAKHPEAGLTAAGRTDPAQQEVAIRLFTAENEKQLHAAGIMPSNANLYAAHFLGAGGAVSVLKSPDGAAMSGVVQPEVIKANSFLRKMTVGDFKAWAARKAGGTAESSQPASQVASLPYDERAALYDKATAVENQIATSQLAETKAAYETHRSGLELGILTGDVVSERQILSDAMLNDDDKATLLRSLRTELGDVADARALLAAIGDGTAPDLNPYDSDDRGKVEKAYDLMVSSVPEEQQTAAAAAFVQETGFVPSSLVADVRKNLTANDAASVAAGLQQAAGLSDTAPQGLDAVEHGKEIRDAAATYDELVNRRGLSIEQAATEVLRLRDPEQKRAAEELETRWKQATKDEAFKVADVLASFDGGWFGGGKPGPGLTPLQESALQADYLAAAERAFRGQANGDVGIARQIALKEMTRTYGVSETSGQRSVMKYPPENFFPAIDGDQSYIRDLTLKDARTLDPEAQNAMLVPTPQTAQDVRAGKPPRYNLMYQRPDGVWDVAPQMFTVGAEEVQELARLGSERRRIEFEAKRERELVQEQKNLPPLNVQTLPMHVMDRVQSGGELPGDADRRGRLDALDAERNEMLGRATMAPSDPLEEERRWLEQQSSTFGMMGGAPSGGQ